MNLSLPFVLILKVCGTDALIYFTVSIRIHGEMLKDKI